MTQIRKVERDMNVWEIKGAIERGGSVRAAATLLGVSHSRLSWWLARNGYEVVKTATIRLRIDIGERVKE